jgi:hypothetical protein
LLLIEIDKRVIHLRLDYGRMGYSSLGGCAGGEPRGSALGEGAAVGMGFTLFPPPPGPLAIIACIGLSRF